LKNYELNLLSNISKILISRNKPIDIINALEKFLNRFGKLTKRFEPVKQINIFLYDDNIKSFRDFAKSWTTLDKEHSDSLYDKIKNFQKYNVYINDNPYRLGEIDRVITNSSENGIFIPLKQNNKTFGILEIVFPQDISSFLTDDFFMMISVASYQISLKIQNTILAEKMQKNINFHKAMKDIAKIIESQYELSYIIPIIGEMIDRFVIDHLIYMFLKKNDSYTLVWPTTCRDKKIPELVSRINSPKTILADGEKIGLFPLIGEHDILGCVVAKSSIEKLSSEEINYIEQLTQQSSITINRANAYAEILKYATSDALTGLNNRRQFEERLKQEVSNAKRQKHPLCAIMLDIDFFKKVNDTYGHFAGDVVLKKVASIIKSALREYDIPSRYGGEEFIILLPSTKLNDAYIVAERLRRMVEATNIDVPTEKGDGIAYTLNVTISSGVYQYKETDTPQEFYQNADKALYVAKESGRNKVIINDGSLES
jgi:diguanylate cyclase (GGDEF)-like protein